MKASGFGGTVFTPDQITEMQKQRYVVGKCATQFQQAFPAIKDPEQFGSAANITNTGGSGLDSLARLDLTSLANNSTGGDPSNVTANIMVNGVLNGSGNTYQYALGFNTDNSAGTGITYAGQPGIDRIVYVNAVDSPGGPILTGSVLDTHTLASTPLSPSARAPRPRMSLASCKEAARNPWFPTRRASRP